MREAEALVARWGSHKPAKKAGKRGRGCPCSRGKADKGIGYKGAYKEAKRGGRIQIEYYSRDDLQRIIDIILK